MPTNLRAFPPPGADVWRLHWLGATRDVRGGMTCDLHLVPFRPEAGTQRRERAGRLRPFPRFADLGEHLDFAGPRIVRLPIGLLPRVRIGRALRTRRESAAWQVPTPAPVCTVEVDVRDPTPGTFVLTDSLASGRSADAPQRRGPDGGTRLESTAQGKVDRYFGPLDFAGVAASCVLLPVVAFTPPNSIAPQPPPPDWLLVHCL